MDDRIHIIKLNPSSRKEKQKMPDDREGLLPFTERKTVSGFSGMKRWKPSG